MESAQYDLQPRPGSPTLNQNGPLQCEVRSASASQTSPLCSLALIQMTDVLILVVQNHVEGTVSCNNANGASALHILIDFFHT